MTANVNVTKLLFKRGNTAQNANYTGINGEITVDTQAKTLRIHDGVTAGGNVITAGGVVGAYSNTNAAAYIPTDPTITSLQSNAATQAIALNTVNANVGAFQNYANITLSTIANAASQESAINSINANVGAYQTFANANAASQTTEINSLRANITAANVAITSLQSNAAVQAALLDTLTGNAATQSQVLDTLTTNAATQATTLTTLLSNAVAQQTSLIDLVANAAVQAQQIANATGTYTNTNVAAYLSAFDGNILPAANVTYSLGDSTHQWKDLWVSNNTIYIGNTPIRVDGSTLLVNGAPVSGDTYSNTNVAAYLLGNITTGNIKSGNLAATGNIVTNVRHWDSAGANLYVWFSAASTPELVTLGTFGNIAGWTVSVSDGNSATVTETNPAGYFSISTDAGLTGSGSLTFTSPDYQGETPAPLTVSSGSSTWTFETDGDLIVPRDIFGTGADPLVIQNTSSGSAYLELPIAPSTNAVYLANQDPTGNVVLRTGDFGSEHDWTFGYNGRLNLPGNVTNGYSEIQFVSNSSGDGYGLDTIRLVPYIAGYDSAYIVIDPTYPNHIHIRAGGEQDNSPAQLFLGGENSYVSVDSGLDPNVYIRSNNNNWTFGTDGNLTIPGNVNYANGVSILSGLGGAVTGNISVDTGAIQFVASSSGDGNGYSTIRMIPDTNLEGTDQYLIIDPTAPGHIHIRAGGDQDSSSADLMLGGENSHVLVTAGSNPPVYIRANSASWMFGVDSSLSMPTGGNLYFDSSATSVIDGLTSVILTDPGYIRHSNLTSEIILSENTFRFESNVGTGSSYIEGQQNDLFLMGNLTTVISAMAGSSTWEFTANGNINLATAGNNPDRGIVFGDGSFQSTAWRGFGNTIAIGYNTGTVSQGGGAVAVGSTAGNVSQGVGAVAVGEAAGTSSQGTEGIAIGKTAGEQSQGAYSIAIGSAAAYYQQRTGAIAIGTSAGALQQGNHAIAIGTGAGSALQGNNSIILNATGSALEQTTDNTFTVKPIRNASSSTVLYYDSTTGEITYDTAGAGSYGNTEVAAYLPAYTGNVGAARVQVTNAVDFMYGGFPYMGWQLSGSDTLKLRTNIASGDYTNDAVIVDRQSLAVNVVATLSAGNIITTSGVFWSNGTAYSTGSGTYGNTEVAAYLLTWPNVDVNILDTTSANITTLRATNFNSANAVISGGYVSALTNASVITATITTLNSTGGNITTLRATNFGTANAVITGGYINSLANLTATTAVFTNFSTGNAVINGGYISSLTNASITTSVVTNFSTANAVITGGYASGLANVTATGNVTAGNLIGYGSNTNIVAGAYTSTFDIAGNVILPNAYVSGNTTIIGIAPGYAPNRPAFRIYGSSSNNWTTANVNFKGSDIVVDYNQGSYFDSTTGVFTAPVAGLYSITLNARIGNNNGQNQIMVLKNAQTSAGNVAVMWECDTNTGTAVHYGVSSVMKLAAGDFLTANITVGTVQFDANDSWTVTYIG